MPAKTARIIFLGIVGVVFGLLAWPCAITIDQTIEATEYSLTDTYYAVPHTVTIKGTYRDSQMRAGNKLCLCLVELFRQSLLWHSV